MFYFPAERKALAVDVVGGGGGGGSQKKKTFDHHRWLPRQPLPPNSLRCHRWDRPFSLSVDINHSGRRVGAVSPASANRPECDHRRSETRSLETVPSAFGDEAVRAKGGSHDPMIQKSFNFIIVHKRNNSSHTTHAQAPVAGAP